MHSCIYHFPFTPRLYQIDSLKVNDILSICNPIFQISVEVDFTPLSSLPVTEADLDVEWVQLSGPEPLEFQTSTTLEPGVIASSDDIQDMQFRLYIDKGTDYEIYVDMWVYRTPTENFKAVPSKLNTVDRVGLLGAYGSLPTAPSWLSAMVFSDVATVPDLNSTYTGGGGEEAANMSVYSAVVSNTKNLLACGHRVTGLYAYDPDTGALLASTTRSSIINIPLNATSFYLVAEVTLNYYTDIPSKKVLVADTQVRASYIAQYERDLTVKSLYVTEGIYNTLTTNLNKATAHNKAVDISLPQVLSFIEQQQARNVNLNGTNTGNFIKQTYSSAALSAPDETLAPKATNTNEGGLYNYTLDRFLGISIGG